MEYNIKITETGNIENNIITKANDEILVNINMVAEGVVWKHYREDGSILQFKVKGEKHAGKSKVKTTQIVDTVKLTSINEFVEYAVTEGRLNQAIENVFTMEGEELDIKKMGLFMKWIMSDIIAEETDTLSDNGLEPKDIGKFVSNKARIWFLEKWNNVK